MSRPSSKTKICSKAVSTIAVQTDLQSTKTSKKENVTIYIIFFILKPLEYNYDSFTVTKGDT